MNFTENDIKRALSFVIEPDLKKDIIELNLVSNIKIETGKDISLKFSMKTKNIKLNEVTISATKIQKIIDRIKLKGATLIALCLYFNKKNIVKIELGLSRGKKQHDKRQSIKDNDWKREQGRLTRDK